MNHFVVKSRNQGVCHTPTQIPFATFAFSVVNFRIQLFLLRALRASVVKSHFHVA